MRISWYFGKIPSLSCFQERWAFFFFHQRLLVLDVLLPPITIETFPSFLHTHTKICTLPYLTVSLRVGKDYKTKYLWFFNCNFYLPWGSKKVIIIYRIRNVFQCLSCQHSSFPVTREMVRLKPRALCASEVKYACQCCINHQRRQAKGQIQSHEDQWNFFSPIISHELWIRSRWKSELCQPHWETAVQKLVCCLASHSCEVGRCALCGENPGADEQDFTAGLSAGEFLSLCMEAKQGLP